MIVRAARRVAVTARRATSTVGDNRVVRLQTEDPRMSKIVIHNGVLPSPKPRHRREQRCCDDSLTQAWLYRGQTSGDVGDEFIATQVTLDKVDALLKEAGTSKSHALSATIWLKDINRDFKGMNEVWNAWVDPENKPVRATVEAAMARDILLVEIQVTAALDKNPFEDLNY